MTETPITHASKDEMSKGEKWYNWIVYSGLNYWANLAASLSIGDYFTNLSGRKQLEKITESTASALRNTNLLTGAQATKISGGIWKTLALTSGGWIASFATKPLEDNKRPIVYWLNKKFGVDQTAPDGHMETSDEIHIVEDQPPQSWWNIIKRRVYASVIIVSAGVGLDHAVGLDNIRHFVVKNTNKALKSGYVPGGKKLTNEHGVFQRYLGFAALDAIFTAMHALTMYMTNGTKHIKMPKEIDDTNDPPGEARLDEIVVYPTPAKKSMEDLKSRKLTPMQNHAERVAATEPQLALAP